MQKSDRWHPSASLENLKLRAKVLSDIRAFFAKKNVLEVETPLLCKSASTDPYLHSIAVVPSSTKERYYLQTSPEFAMKRLLAAGSGAIYQLCKAFRDDEVGRLHNPEFTMLEWYRPGFDHHRLMDEVGEFLSVILNTPKAKRFSYETLFTKTVALNPHQATVEELRNCAVSKAITLCSGSNDLQRDDWLDILMTHCIEPQLGFQEPVMIYDYPESKAALAKIRLGDTPVAERFEVYVRGVELANGYHELTEPVLQRERFKRDNQIRAELNYPRIPIDEYLLSALEQGLPDSAGVALGVDRLIMLKLGSDDIRKVLAFTSDQA